MLNTTTKKLILNKHGFDDFIQAAIELIFLAFFSSHTHNCLKFVSTFYARNYLLSRFTKVVKNLMKNIFLCQYFSSRKP